MSGATSVFRAGLPTYRPDRYSGPLMVDWKWKPFGPDIRRCADQSDLSVASHEGLPVCVVRGRGFHAKRRDAKTCGPTCRSKLYRSGK